MPHVGIRGHQPQKDSARKQGRNKKIENSIFYLTKDMEELKTYGKNIK
jgi:hypothetical protein